MGKLHFHVTVFFFAVAIFAICAASTADPIGKHWPDVSCRDYIDNDWRAQYPQQHKETWERCQIRNNETGQCAKTCVLREYRILYTRGRWPSDRTKKTVCYNTGEAEGYYMQELGLKFPQNMEEGSEKQVIREKIQRIGNPIMEKTDLCNKKFGLQFLERNIKGPCSEWADLLDCLDEAYGCSSKEFKHK